MRSTHSARMRVFLCLSLALLLVSRSYGGEISAKPVGQMTHAIHFTIAPTYFYPAETTGITSFLFLYALHDASVKSMPDNP
jgi:peptide/nickel transport system substrate-binding protein